MIIRKYPDSNNNGDFPWNTLGQVLISFSWLIKRGVDFFLERIHESGSVIITGRVEKFFWIQNDGFAAQALPLSDNDLFSKRDR